MPEKPDNSLIGASGVHFVCGELSRRGFIVLKSSNNRYHVVFDRKVTWSMNVKIMGWACLFTKHKSLTGWFILQCIKQGSTLRVSPKKEKPAPRIVYRQGRRDEQVRDFLNYRKLLRSIQSRVYS
jgi:hypothetical protein